MTIPLSHYVSIKNKYCISYFGSDKEKAKKLFKARDLIEKELPDIKIYLIMIDEMRTLIRGKRNVTIESNMESFRGKVAYSRTLEENEEIESLLTECNITIPDDF